jgi:hypothetical protein
VSCAVSCAVSGLGSVMDGSAIGAGLTAAGYDMQQCGREFMTSYVLLQCSGLE